MINLTEAVVRPGESLATFPITVPRPTGTTSAQQRCIGKPRQISFSSTGVRDIPYHIYVSLTQRKKIYPFVVKTDNIDNNRPEKVAARLANHFNAAEDVFPLQRNLPRMTYNTDDLEDPHWILDMPGRSALYSAQSEFFLGLGFGKHKHLASLNRLMGGRGRTPAYKETVGFYNTSRAQMLYRGETMWLGDSINTFLGRTRIVPPECQLQIELMDWGRITIPSPDDEEKRQPATKENAIRILTAQLERIAEAFSLVSNPIQLISGPGDVIKLRCEAQVKDPGMGLAVLFNPEMIEAYSLNEGPLMSFPLNTTRTVEFEVRDSKHDPFENMYPILMRAAGFGLPISYVEGLGHTSVFAYLPGKSGDRILSDGVTLETERSYLSVQFYDRDQKLVVFKDGHKMSLLLQFQFL